MDVPNLGRQYGPASGPALRVTRPVRAHVPRGKTLSSELWNMTGDNMGDVFTALTIVFKWSALIRPLPWLPGHLYSGWWWFILLVAEQPSEVTACECCSHSLLGSWESTPAKYNNTNSKQLAELFWFKKDEAELFYIVDLSPMYQKMIKWTTSQ